MLRILALSFAVSTGKGQICLPSTVSSFHDIFIPIFQFIFVDLTCHHRRYSPTPNTFINNETPSSPHCLPPTNRWSREIKAYINAPSEEIFGCVFSLFGWEQASLTDNTNFPQIRTTPSSIRITPKV